MTTSLHNRILPPGAASRLSRYENNAATAMQAAEAAKRRREEIENAFRANVSMSDQDRAQLEIELRDHATAQGVELQRHRDNADLLATLRTFVESLGVSERKIEEAPAVPFKLKKNESLKTCLARLRDEINTVKRAQRDAAIAPLPVEDLKAQAVYYVERLASQVFPRPTPAMGRGDGFGLSFFGDDPTAIKPLNSTHTLALLCWFDPEKATERLVEAVGHLPRPNVPALSAFDKAERIKELAAHLDMLERQEEACVLALHQEGFTNVVRRSDASAMAVLSIQYVQPGKLKPLPRRPTAANGANGTHAKPEKKSEPRVLLHPKDPKAHPKDKANARTERHWQS